MQDKAERFCVDESSFQDLGDSISEAIIRVNDILVRVHEQGLKTFKSSLLDGIIASAPDTELCQVMYDSSLGILDEDERQLFIQVINRCVVWDLEHDVSDETTIVDDQVNKSFSLRFAAEQQLAGTAIAVVPAVPATIATIKDVQVDGQHASVCFVNMPASLQVFYRFVIVSERVNKDEFAWWSERAFERLKFALPVSSQLGKFRQSYESVREVVVRHLSALNDGFLEMVRDGIEPSEVCRRISAQFGVTMSPENANTHGNSRAMRQREVQYDGVTHVCEFHTKLTLTHDRIYFCHRPLEVEEDDFFIVVGPFAEHLTV